jgi:hypothetical protein
LTGARGTVVPFPEEGPVKPIVVARRAAAPAERLFALASDFAGAPGRVSGILRVEMVTPGAVGKGTRFRETRKMFGKEATEEMEVVAFEPGRSYTLRAISCGAEFESELRCLPDGAGSRVEIEMRSRPLTFFAKLMSPLGGLFAGSMVKCVEQDLADIARAAEGGARPPAPPGAAAQPAA